MNGTTEHERSAHETIGVGLAWLLAPSSVVQRGAELDSASTRDRDTAASPRGNGLHTLHSSHSLAGSNAQLPPFGAIVLITNTLDQTIRHCDWQAFTGTPDGSDDFHWTLVPALNGVAGAVSLESVNYPGEYLTPGPLGSEATRLLVTASPIAADASYNAVPGIANASQWSFASMSSNPAYAGLYISQIGTLSGDCANRYQSPCGDVILAASGAAAAVSQTWNVYLTPPPPPATLSINVSTVDHVIPSRFMGCHADPGYVQSPLGFTPSMVYGNAFEVAGTESYVYSWNNVSSANAVGSAVLDSTVQVNPKVNAPSLKLQFSSGSGYIGWSNRGIGNEGLSWTSGLLYDGLAVVYAPTGATFYFGAHNRNAGTVDASTTVVVQASTAWQVINFTLSPSADATCVGIVNGSDPTISCNDPATGNGGSGAPTNPGADVCVRCDGEFVVGLAASGTAWIGFADFRPGAWGTFGPRGLAQKRTMDVFASMGIAAIRQGGTVSQTFAWKEWRGLPWARGAMQHYWEDRLIPSTWGPFEFIETAAAAGIEPILTFAYDLNNATDWGDLVGA